LTPCPSWRGAVFNMGVEGIIKKKNYEEDI